MRYVALAAGFEGVLSGEGRSDPYCIEALQALAATGRKLILVTGLELRELLERFPQARLFDVLIAEHGAVMYRTVTRQSAILGQAPSAVLLQEFARQRVRVLSVGSSCIRVGGEHEADVRDAIARLHIDAQIIPADGWISVLPPGVESGAAILAALRELGLSRHGLVALGAAASELNLFKHAAHAVALRDAHPLTLQAADAVTMQAGCAGFAAFARELIATDLSETSARHRITLAGDAVPLTLAPGKQSALIYGPPGAGKQRLCEQLLDELLLHEYQCCLLTSGPAPIVRSPLAAFGVAHEAPRLTDVLTALENPAVSVAISLAALPAETRPVFAEALLQQLHALYERAARPHCLVLQQPHTFMSAEAVRAALRLPEISLLYFAEDSRTAPIELLPRLRYVIALGDAAEVPAPWREQLAEPVQATIAGGASGWISALRDTSTRSTRDSVAAVSG